MWHESLAPRPWHYSTLSEGLRLSMTGQLRKTVMCPDVSLVPDILKARIRFGPCAETDWASFPCRAGKRGYTGFCPNAEVQVPRPLVGSIRIKQLHCRVSSRSWHLQWQMVNNCCVVGCTNCVGKKKASVSTVSLQLDKGQTLIWPLSK